MGPPRGDPGLFSAPRLRWAESPSGGACHPPSATEGSSLSQSQSWLAGTFRGRRLQPRTSSRIGPSNHQHNPGLMLQEMEDTIRHPRPSCHQSPAGHAASSPPSGTGSAAVSNPANRLPVPPMLLQLPHGNAVGNDAKVLMVYAPIVSPQPGQPP